MTRNNSAQPRKKPFWRRAFDWLRGRSSQQQLRKFRRDLNNRQDEGWTIQKNTAGEKSTVLPPIRLRPPTQTNPDDRDLPVILRGRNAEFSFIASRIGTMPRPIIVLEGSPGAGKSALLHAAEHYARHQGFLTVNLKHTRIDNRDTFLQGLQSEMETDLKQNLRETKNIDKGIFRVIHNFGAIAWADDSEKITRQAVALAQECGFRGILITIDEAQHWGEEYITKEKVPPFAKELFLHLNDQHTEEKKQYPIQLVVAGTYGTEESVRRIMSRRLARGHAINIGPIHDTAIAQIIQDRLNFVCPDGTVPLPPPPQIITEAQIIAQGHTAHATNLAEDLTEIAILAGRTRNLDYYEDKIPAIIKTLHHKRDEYYLQRKRALEENVTLATLFAYLEQRAGGNLKVDEVEGICEKLLAEQKVTKQKVRKFTEILEDYILDLRRRNILTSIAKSNVDEGSDETVAIHYYISPTPSFSSFLVRTTKQTAPKKHQHLQTLAAELLPEVGTPTQRWQPPLDATITPYEEIRPFTVPGRADGTKLHPPLECDTEGIPLTANDIQRICHEQGIKLQEPEVKQITHTGPKSIIDRQDPRRLHGPVRSTRQTKSIAATKESPPENDDS